MTYFIYTDQLINTLLMKMKLSMLVCVWSGELYSTVWITGRLKVRGLGDKLMKDVFVRFLSRHVFKQENATYQEKKHRKGMKRNVWHFMVVQLMQSVFDHGFSDLHCNWGFFMGNKMLKSLIVIIHAPLLTFARDF